MRRKLFWSILAACVTLVVTVTVTAEIAQQANTRDRVFANLERQATVVAARIESNLPDVFRGDVIDSVQGFLDGIEASAEIDLRVGVVVASGVEYLDGSNAVLDSQVATQLEAGEAVRTRFRSGFRAETVRVTAPVEVGGRRGVVVASREIPIWSLSALVSTWRIPFLFALVVSAVAAELVARRLTKRLGTLTDAVDGYRRGKLTQVPTEGGDELAELGTAFNAMAEEIDSAQRRENDFLMDISHDLRTPLTTIVGYSEMLEGSAEPTTAEVGGALSREALRLSRLIGDLMLLARLRASQFTARHDLLDIAGVVTASVEGFRAVAQRSQIELRVTGDPLEAESDAERLGQIVGNLLDNAIRHTPSGGMVSVDVVAEGDDVLIVVTDTGPGVQPHRLEVLFERLDAGPDRPSGSGLGLAIVRELAQLLGGDASARNADPHGLSVSVRFPQKAERSLAE